MLKKLKYYIPIIIMLAVAAVVGVLLLNGTLEVQELIASVQSNKPVALAVIIALFLLKGCSLGVPYAAILIGCALVFDIVPAVAINTVGTALCISVSYFIGRFSKGLSFEGIMAKYPKFERYFNNATNYSFTFCFAMHTLHLSMEVQGVLFGLLRTPYWAYIGGSMLALLPSMMWFTVIGDQFDFANPLFWLFVGLDVLTVIIGLIYAKRNIIDGGKSR